MSLLRKIFSPNTPTPSTEDNNGEYVKANSSLTLDERFTFNFKKNGGKFIYCENLDEVREQFENILEENDWFESEALCFEPFLFNLLEENKLMFDNPTQPKFLLASCENLIADEGSILFSSKQIKHNKPNDLPDNIVILGTTSQILENKGEGLRMIKVMYEKDYPSNITSINYFKKSEEENFLNYGSAPKNLYLLLLEDQ